MGTSILHEGPSQPTEGEMDKESEEKKVSDDGSPGEISDNPDEDFFSAEGDSPQDKIQTSEIELYGHSAVNLKDNEVVVFGGVSHLSECS